MATVSVARVVMAVMAVMVSVVMVVVRMTLGAPLSVRAVVGQICVQVGGVSAVGEVLRVSAVVAAITRRRRRGTVVVGRGKV